MIKFGTIIASYLTNLEIMQTQDCKIPKWKKKKEEMKQQSFDDAFAALGARQEFYEKKKKKEVVCEEVNS